MKLGGKNRLVCYLTQNFRNERPTASGRMLRKISVYGMHVVMSPRANCVTTLFVIYLWSAPLPSWSPLPPPFFFFGREMTFSLSASAVAMSL